MTTDDIVCKGDKALGTACGRCSRCLTSDQKPTSVFVRLPITDEQAQEMYQAYCAAYASSSLTTRGTATQAALLAIGTPVAGGELEKTTHQLVCAGIRNALVSNWSAGVCALHAKADLLAQEVLARNPEAVAKLVARDAEIARLQEDLGKETGAYLRLLSRRSVAEIIAENKEVARLREALVTARDAITSDLNAKSIVCTVWAGPAETLVDYIDAALKGGAA